MTRITELLKAKMEKVVDKIEKPEEMLPIIVDGQERLCENVQMNTAEVMARAKNVKRKITEVDEEIQKMEQYARLAVESNSDENATKFLMKKEELVKKKEELEKHYAIQCDNAGRMIDLGEQMHSDLEEMKLKKEILLGSKTVADTQMMVNRMTSKAENVNSYKSKFEKNQDKIHRYMDKADSYSMLEKFKSENDIIQLEKEYDTRLATAKVQSELLAIKSEVEAKQLETAK